MTRCTIVLILVIFSVSINLSLSAQDASALKKDVQTKTPVALPNDEKGDRSIDESSNLVQEIPQKIKKNPVIEIVIVSSAGLNTALDKTDKLRTITSAVKNAVQFIDKDTAVGLRVSGHRVAENMAEKSCQDSELLLRPEKMKSNEVNRALNGLVAQGKRSVFYSLVLAIQDLETFEGKKSIIVIADGPEECFEQDPSVIFKKDELKEKGFSIHIRSLAKEVDPSLKTLADAVGGTVNVAADSFSFTQQLAVVVQKKTVAHAASDLPASSPDKDKQLQVIDQVKSTVPVADPPEGMKPTPRVPPSVGPTPLPFNPDKFRKQIVDDVVKRLSERKKRHRFYGFSTKALIVIGIETVLLLLALIAMIRLAKKR
jgi:hypothetical protein